MDIMHQFHHVGAAETDGVCLFILLDITYYRKNAITVCAVTNNSDNRLETANIIGIFGNIPFSNIWGFPYFVCKFGKVYGCFFVIVPSVCQRG